MKNPPVYPRWHPCAKCKEGFNQTDSKRTRCKLCERDRNNASYERWKERIKSNGKTPKAKKYQKKYHAERNQSDEAYIAKKKARGAVNTALASGRIRRLSCEVCGSPVTEAHHDDYSKPLVVRWVCRPDHARIHREARAMLEERDKPENQP